MNMTHLHLLTNHLPILGSLFGILILLSGYIFKDLTVRKAGLGTFIFAALMAVPAYLTGEPSEKAIKNLPDIAKGVIEQHETLAAFALGCIILLGMLSATAFYLMKYKKTDAKLLMACILSLSMVTFGLMVWTAQTGGQIRHSEIRPADFPASKMISTEEDE
jgi:uncharacterized membrane protein